MTERPIRVALVDDHPLWREGTRGLLERNRGITVVGAAEDGGSALRLVAEQRPDVLLLDLHLPDLSGVEVARRVRASCPAVAVLVLTGHDDVRYVRALQQLGVRGYLPKTVSGDQLLLAIRAVAEGQAIFLSAALPATGDTGAVGLTAREREILQLLVAGRHNDEIAAALGISVKTVDFHVGNLLKKLGARSRAQAAHLAHQRGLLPPGAPGDPALGAGRGAAGDQA